MTDTLVFDTAVIGGGSAGFGAAYASASSGAKTVLIERMPGIGGMSVFGGVNCWEPGYGGLGIHLALARDLIASGGGCVIHDDGIAVGPDRPYANCLPAPDREYGTTFKVPDPAHVHDTDHFMFEPEAMSGLMRRYLESAGCRIMTLTEMKEPKLNGDRIESVYAEDPGGCHLIKADVFVDCTDDASLSRMCGCRIAVGEDSSSDTGEYSTPDEARENAVNGVSLIFRCSPTVSGHIDGMPDKLRDVDLSDFIRRLDRREIYSVVNHYPCGDVNVNMLPTMDGGEYLGLGKEAGHVMEARVWAYLIWLQKTFGFPYRMKSLFPVHGVRENVRIIGRYRLSETDLRLGMFSQPLAGRLIAFADHMIDVHGTSKLKRRLSPWLDVPYGIPYDCLLTGKCENLLTASHSSSFTHIAAASVRLSRTMMALGEAAGYAASMAARSGKLAADIDIEELKKKCKTEECTAQLRGLWNIG